MFNTIDEVKQYVTINGDIQLADLTSSLRTALTDLYHNVGQPVVNALIADHEDEVKEEAFDGLRNFVANRALASFLISNQFTIGANGNRAVRTDDAMAPKMWEVQASQNELLNTADKALAQAVSIMVANIDAFPDYRDGKQFQQVAGLIFRTAEDFNAHQFINGSFISFRKMISLIRQKQVMQLNPILGGTVLDNLVTYINQNPDGGSNVVMNDLLELCRGYLAPLAYCDAIRANIITLQEVAGQTVITNAWRNAERTSNDVLLTAISQAGAVANTAERALRSFLKLNSENIPGFAAERLATRTPNSDTPVFRL